MHRSTLAVCSLAAASSAPCVGTYLSRIHIYGASCSRPTRGCPLSPRSGQFRTTCTGWRCAPSSSRTRSLIGESASVLSNDPPRNGVGLPFAVSPERYIYTKHACTAMACHARTGVMRCTQLVEVAMSGFNRWTAVRAVLVRCANFGSHCSRC